MVTLAPEQASLCNSLKSLSCLQVSGAPSNVLRARLRVSIVQLSVHSNRSAIAEKCGNSHLHQFTAPSQPSSQTTHAVVLGFSMGAMFSRSPQEAVAQRKGISCQESSTFILVRRCRSWKCLRPRQRREGGGTGLGLLPWAGHCSRAP